MIISRTPLRMSFVGGGSDLPVFYRKYGGAVISTTIDKYIYVNINKKFDKGVRLAYSKTEEVDRVEDIEHPLFKATFNLMKVEGGVEITTIADIPSRGTEIDICGAPIGKQDQYAAACGGFNTFEFHSDDRVSVTPIIMPRALLQSLESQIVLFYTGMVRSASHILMEQSDQVGSDAAKQDALRRMVDLTYQMRDMLQAGEIQSFGEILDENWHLKKSLASGVSTSDIDAWYSLGKAAGADGGKILGAGAGGFLMFCAPPERHPAIEAALHFLRRVPFRFEPQGSKIVFYGPTTAAD